MSDLEKEVFEAELESRRVMMEKADELGTAVCKAAVSGEQAIEKGVVSGYQKIEDTVVGTYKKVEDAFVGQFLTHEGETVEQAKARLAKEQAAREEHAKAAQHTAMHKAPGKPDKK